MNSLETLRKSAAALDQADPLSAFRDCFTNVSEVIYLDGNSLGRLPVATAELMHQVINDQWGDRLIRGWNEHWLKTPPRIAGKIAKIVGAEEHEIFVGDSTSVNLFKLAYGVLAMQTDRTQILSDDLNFPSDFYVMQGLINSHFHNHQLVIHPSSDGIHAPIEALKAGITANTALICLSHVAFKSAYMYDMAGINALAESAGAKVIWDLSHAVGAVPLKLNEWGAELAVGCTYKYLNGGPGAPAFLYVKKQLQPILENAIWAWFGHAEPFQFELQYRPRLDIWKYAVGTPPILSMAAIEPGLDLLVGAGMDNIRQKSLSMSTFFYKAFQQLLEPAGFVWASPISEQHRGSHIALRHPEGYRICQALIHPMDGAKPVIPDFRRPDNIRLGFAPLYNTHTEILQAAERMAEIIRTKAYLNYNPVMETVT